MMISSLSSTQNCFAKDRNKYILYQGYPMYPSSEVGDILCKMVKNYMKITKSTLLGQNSGRTWGDKPIFKLVGDTPQSPH